MMMTFAPSRARRIAIARPVPLEATVTRAAFPERARDTHYLCCKIGWSIPPPGRRLEYSNT